MYSNLCIPSGNIKINNGKKWTGRYREIFYLEGVERKGVKIEYPNGMIKEEGITINNQKIGRWTFYHNNGKRKSPAQQAKMKSWTRPGGKMFRDLITKRKDRIKKLRTKK